MRTVSATEAKQRFGEVLDQVREGPVTIQKNGRDVAVLLTPEQFDRYISEGGSEERLRQKVLASHERSMKRWNHLYEELAK